jgi:hypothetical protein
MDKFPTAVTQPLDASTIRFKSGERFISVNVYAQDGSTLIRFVDLPE